MKTIGYYAQGFDNNLNLIRFVAAASVIFSHSYLVTDNSRPLVSLIGRDTGEIAVNIFFAISGFLVAKSYCQRNDVLAYLESRILRIFPGLILAVLFSVFVIGPLLTTLSLTKYLSHQTIYEFLIINSTLLLDTVHLRYHLPGVFFNNPYPDSVNVPLWSLPYELWMYILLLLVGIAGILKKQALANLVIFVIIISSVGVYYYYEESDMAVIVDDLKRLAPFFFMGVFFYVNRDIIPLNIFITLGVIILAVLFRQTPFFVLFLALAIVYVTFWLAYVPGGYIRKFNQVGDYSYGLYIYAFPIQQSIVALYPSIEPSLVFIISLPATLILAILSWHFIEKPALKRKGSLQKILHRESYSNYA